MKTSFFFLLSLSSFLTGLLFVTPVPDANAASSPAIVQSKEKQINFQKFSIRAPQHWLIERSDRLTFYNQRPPRLGGRNAPPFLIKTEALMSSHRLSNLPKPEPIDGRLIKVETLQIDGKPAIRRWFGKGEDFDRTIQTFIQYNERETIVVNSYYGSRNPAAEAVIYRLHNSVKLRSSPASSRV